MRTREPEDVLQELHRRGARRLQRVSFRANRSTIWSLTRRGTALNLHVAYRRAPASVFDAFATIVRCGGRDGPDYRVAARTVREWPGLEPILTAVREVHSRKRRSRCGSGAPTPCCGTDDQRGYLAAVYRYLNRTRFDGLLPEDIPVRLSRRMTTSLGHMLPGHDRRRGRYVEEIALNVDLMLPGNGAERMDTLLHEMAHAADYLFDGELGHGPTWRAWARHVGCRGRACYDRPVARRRRRREVVDRVPPLPRLLRGRAA